MGKKTGSWREQALSVEPTPQSLFASESIRQAAYYCDDQTIILHAEARDGARILTDNGIQVDCIVTSPPFYGQRDYGVDGQIGLEDDPADFIKELVECFNAYVEVLKPTGSLWVNIGDTYWSGRGQHRSGENKQSARRFGLRPQDKRRDGPWTRPKQLLLIPHRFAMSMQESGWIVRNDNVWVKPNPIPDQVRDRCSVSHEYVFHFVRERFYYFVRERVGRKTATGSTMPPLDTWMLPSSRGGNGHKASFSEDLVKIPVRATCPPKGVVLDPFAGSGTTLSFTRSSGFRAIGVDIKEEYCAIMQSACQTPVQLDLEGEAQ